MFHRMGGDLHVERVPLREIAETHGTPCFVYSEAGITAAYREFDAAFARRPHAIRYAVKANSNLAVLQLLHRLGSGFDIVSGGELTRVLRAGGDAGKVVFSGVGKQDWEIEYALKAGIGCLNVESASELGRIARLAGALDVTAPVAIRVNPDVDPNTHPYIATGLMENKFGVAMDEALELYRRVGDNDSFEIVGIACHIGSQIIEFAPFLDALTRILALAEQLQTRGIALRHLDLGGGIGVRYRDEQPPAVRTLADAIDRIMADRPELLLFEPGRLIVANAGVLLTRVNTLKHNHEKNFAVADAAMNDLIRPALYNAWQDVEPVRDRRGTPLTWDLVGPVCETGDFLARARALVLEEGDLLAIRSAGAYGFVMSSNYNTRTRAAEVLVSGDEHHCVRRRESIEDLLRLESLKPDS